METSILLSLVGLIMTIAFVVIGGAIAWGQHSARLRTLELQVNNDVTGRAAIVAHGKTLAEIGISIKNIDKQLDRMPCNNGAACITHREVRSQ